MGLVVQGVRCSPETQSGRFVHDVWWCAATQNLGIAVPNGDNRIRAAPTTKTRGSPGFVSPWVRYGHR